VTRRNEQRLRAQLRQLEPPGAADAERRAWAVAGAAFDERSPRQRRSPARRLALAAALLAAAAATAFTPAGAAVGDWVKDVVRPGRHDARPAIGRLPGAGRLLVSSPAGASVVRGDGSTRRLGGYDEAGWSPGGLFAVVTRGRQLVAVEPGGAVHWTISRPRRVSLPAWSPRDGYRVAYLSGGALRVVAGDGTGDRLVAGRAAPVRPAWRPGPGYLVAYVAKNGRVVLADADTGRRLWRSPPGPRPRALQWTPDGRRLVALAPSAVRVLARDGRGWARLAVPAGKRADAMAVHPDGDSVAVIRRVSSSRSEVVSVPLRVRAGERLLFAGQGAFTDLAWSPDGRWLLVAWRDADQWLFIRSSRVPRIEAVSGIRRQFDPGGPGIGAFPRIAGWCCPSTR
jgi:WD40-like Beta Propeller Repeat